jgi:type IV pilus assembly protein PilO
LNDISLTSQKGGGALTMDATARTFRYLDENEVAQQKKAAPKGGKKK